MHERVGFPRRRPPRAAREAERRLARRAAARAAQPDRSAERRARTRWAGADRRDPDDPSSHPRPGWGRTHRPRQPTIPAKDARSGNAFCANSVTFDKRSSGAERSASFTSHSYYARRSTQEREALVDKYLLVPLEDTVVFPNMTVNLPLDLAGETHVLLVPRHEGTYANVGTIAEVVEIARLRRRRRPSSTLTGQQRALLGAAETASDGRLFVEVEERPDETPPPVQDARARDRVPRDRRGDPRAAEREPLDRRVPPLGHRAGRARRHLCLRTRPALRAASRAARDARRRRAARARDLASSASGSPSCRCAAASTTTSSPARRSSSASTSCASRWSRSARSSARTTAP